MAACLRAPGRRSRRRRGTRSSRGRSRRTPPPCREGRCRRRLCRRCRRSNGGQGARGRPRRPDRPRERRRAAHSRSRRRAARASPPGAACAPAGGGAARCAACAASSSAHACPARPASPPWRMGCGAGKRPLRARMRRFRPPLLWSGAYAPCRRGFRGDGADARRLGLGGGVGLCYSGRPVGVLLLDVPVLGDRFDTGRLRSPSTASEPRQWQLNSPSWEARARPRAETRRVDARSAFRSDNNG